MKEEELRCILKLEKENSELVKKVKIGIKRLLNQNDQKDKEIERLNNIIDGLEKFFVELNLEKLTSFDDYMLGEYSAYKNVFKKFI